MSLVTGNIEGIRRSYIDQLESLYDTPVERKEFGTQEIYDTLAYFTGQTGREAMVYLDRYGRVLSVTVGESDRVALPAMRKRRSEGRLSGIRVIHTHPNGVGRLSDVDKQALKKSRFDAMAAIGVVDGKASNMQVGILESMESKVELTVELLGPYKMSKIPDDVLWEKIAWADETIKPEELKQGEFEIARAILVGIEGDKDNEEPLEELRQLADTAGFNTVGSLLQQRNKPDNSYYLGYGKLQELSLEIQRLQADTIIFDDELSPAQLRNIQTELGKIELIDRTYLILDIFSMRAKTHEGRLQVELAQAKYLLPRLTGYWSHMGRMGGGGAGGGGARRGEGETQLEVDRRLLRRRAHELEKEIDLIKHHRNIQRANRERSNIPVVALVGYTNAGKSTLMNHMSGSNVLAEDKLFATLDAVSRRINFGYGDFLLVDTVGFIKKLPHDLVNAFRATLEEARYADLLLHVVDTSSEDRLQQMEVVQQVLEQLEANQTPTLTVFNKCDVADGVYLGEDSIAISAKTGQGMEGLKEAIALKLADKRMKISMLLPLDAGAMISRIYDTGQVDLCEYYEDGVLLNAIVPVDDAARLKAIAIEVYLSKG